MVLRSVIYCASSTFGLFTCSSVLLIIFIPNGTVLLHFLHCAKLFGIDYMLALHFAHSSMSFLCFWEGCCSVFKFPSWFGEKRVKFGPAACLLFSIPVTVGLQNPEMVQFLVTLALVLRSADVFFSLFMLTIFFTNSAYFAITFCT